MSVDKFGRHEIKAQKGLHKGTKANGYKITNYGNYDMQFMILRNIADPILPSDGVTKRYIESIIPIQSVDHFYFYNKRLTEIANPVEDKEAVNFWTLKARSLTRNNTYANEDYDDIGLRIKNVNNGIDEFDVATLANVQSSIQSALILVKNAISKLEEQIVTLGTKLSMERNKTLHILKNYTVEISKVFIQ